MEIAGRSTKSAVIVEGKAAYKRLEFCRSIVMLTSEHAGAKRLHGRES